MSITATVIGEAVQLTGNPIRIQCTGGSVPAGASEYKITLKITSEDGKLEGAPFTDAIAPDSSGEAWFNIAGYVDQPVKALFQFPPSGASVAYPTQAFNIQIQPGERYIDEEGNLQESWGTTSSIFQMLKGGLSPRQIAMMNDYGTNFFDTYIAGNKWLTPRPWGEMVHPTQAVKLWFMVAANIGATFTVKTYFDDGSDNIYTSAVALNKDSLHEFNCNPANLGVDIEPTGKRASHFDVWLQMGSSSQVRRFTFDWQFVERPVFLMFANSLGGIDDVYFRGYIKDKFNTEGDTVYHPPLRDDTVFDPTLLTPNKSGQNKWIFNTGWKPITTLQFYRDLLVSKQAWYLYSNISITSYIVIPVIINNGDKVLFSRKDNLFSIDIEVSEAHQTKFSFDNRMY